MSLLYCHEILLESDEMSDDESRETLECAAYELDLIEPAFLLTQMFASATDMHTDCITETDAAAAALVELAYQKVDSQPIASSCKQALVDPDTGPCTPPVLMSSPTKVAPGAQTPVFCLRTLGQLAAESVPWWEQADDKLAKKMVQARRSGRSRTPAYVDDGTRA